MGTDLGRTLGLVALLEALLVLRLGTALQRALDQLHPGHSVIIQVRFGLDGGVKRSPESIAESLGVDVRIIEEWLQEALLALADILKEQRTFSFTRLLQETDEEFINRIRGSKLDTTLFQAACKAVLEKRRPHSQARMNVLFHQKGIDSLSSLLTNIWIFGPTGRETCEAITKEARRQETLLL